MKDKKPIPSIDVEVIEQMRKLQKPGKPDFLNSLIDLYFETSKEEIELMKKALKDRDPVKLAEVAHSLKSSSANLGANHLAALFLQLEIQGGTGFVNEVADAIFKVTEKEYFNVINDLKEFKTN